MNYQGQFQLIVVLQGESASPLLFNLYIYDIISKLQNSDCRGINLYGYETHALLFADDLVILSDSIINLQRKIKLIESHFTELKLKINLTKTKIMIFRKSGRIKKIKNGFYTARKLKWLIIITI